MAELAVVGSAVGIVSLGRKFCGGLIKYCNTYKDYDKDSKGIFLRLRGLTNILETLSSVLNESDIAHRPSFQPAEGSIIACSDAIRELESLLKKYTGTPNPGTSMSTVSRHVQRARYPLRKAELVALNSVLNDLEFNLGHAIQVVQLYALLVSWVPFPAAN
ncbi:hypothetical protein LTR37_002545 [Vermiconidia calcicola]|uniref:Uncharacterized protein n=1 Tax=Vermiconidia calcicola TaxID=1690605 RepID=A0ACC3NSB7_9PEZI|nr:hypothetical protein LTR37_002545 [Vermiconidia calcicola]